MPLRTSLELWPLRNVLHFSAIMPISFRGTNNDFQGGGENEGEMLNMPDNAEINFDAPATLRKWPSVNNQRVSASLGAHPYLIIDGTLDECIRKFMAMPVGQHHLYEIYTTPQPDLVSAVLSAAHIVEFARLRDFL